MPTTYVPEFSYYNGNKNPLEGDFFIFKFLPETITIYHFLTKNIADVSSANAEVFSANTFFDQEIPYSSNPINMENVNTGKPPYINHIVTPLTIELVDNFLLSYSDVANKFNLIKNFILYSIFILLIIVKNIYIEILMLKSKIHIFIFLIMINQFILNNLFSIIF